MLVVQGPGGTENGAPLEVQLVGVVHTQVAGALVLGQAVLAWTWAAAVYRERESGRRIKD